MRQYKILLIIVLCTVWVCCREQVKKPRAGENLKTSPANTDSLNAEGWAKYERKVDSLKSYIYRNRNDMKPEEVKKLNKLIGEYYAAKAKSKLKNLTHDVEDLLQRMEGMYESIKSEDKK